MGLVKHTAGLTLVDEKSSKRKGTNTTLPLIMKWPPIGKSVDILFWFLQEIKGWISTCSSKPFFFINISFFRHKDDNTNPCWPAKRQRFIEDKLSLSIDRCGSLDNLFNNIHNFVLLCILNHGRGRNFILFTNAINCVYTAKLEVYTQADIPTSSE